MATSILVLGTKNEAHSQVIKVVLQQKYWLEQVCGAGIDPGEAVKEEVIQVLAANELNGHKEFPIHISHYESRTFDLIVSCGVNENVVRNYFKSGKVVSFTPHQKFQSNASSSMNQMEISRIFSFCQNLIKTHV